MKIKVCGMREAENIQQLTALQTDYLGFIFYSKSPRFAGEMKPEIFDTMPSSISKVGVFVNENTDVIEQMVNQYHLNAVQLHGGESPDFCGRLKGKVEVWKAFGVNDSFNFNQLNAYEDQVDYFLFDTKTEVHGGSGQTFNWQVLNNYQLNVPFFLSGGLSLENLASVKEMHHPQFYGVDLNSRFETEPGIKDITKLQQAFNLLRPITNEIRS
ncbi:phosphoribosylanthranilate isomerase [Mucilaginibacter koreensis]